MDPTELELTCHFVDPHAKVSNLQQNLLQAYFSGEGGLLLQCMGLAGIHLQT